MMSNIQKNNRPSLRSFLILSLILGFISLWVTGHNYLNDSALLRWSKLLTILDAPEIHLEYIGLMHPHIPIYLLAPFYYIKGLATPAAPYLLSVLCGGLLLTIWNYHLQTKHYGRLTRFIFIALTTLNPLFLWSVTSGSEKALSLVMFYILCFSVLRTLLQRDTRAIILLAGALGIYFFVDERAFFIAVAFLPLIALIAPPKMLEDSALSVFLIITLPIVFAIASWFYLNWIFHGDASSFLTSPDSTFLGTRMSSGESAWLLRYGGTLFLSTLIALITAITCFPSIIWYTYNVWRSARLRRGLEVYFLIPVIATGLATSHYFISHAADMLFLLTAGTMIGLLYLPVLNRQKKIITATLLLVSNITSGALFYWQPSPDMLQWRQAVTGQTIRSVFEDERQLGLWLSREQRPTLIDDRAAYRIIAARGSTKDFVLSFTPEFKLALKRPFPVIEQIVVMNPAHQRAYLDRITQRYPDLYQHGMTGYKLVFQSGPWNVYRKISLQRPLYIPQIIS